MSTDRDVKYIWHPYTQAKNAAPNVHIVKAEGAWIEAADGTRYLDAGASWWTNIHGHSHPYIASRLAKQAATLEHVIFAGFTHDGAMELSERLLQRLPDNQQKIFFSDNGSTAVEVALKMSIQYWHNQGKHKKKFIALRGAYHGDTFGAMAVSARGAFTRPFADLFFDTIFIDVPLPGKEEEVLQKLRHQCDINADDIAAFIFEPLIMGTAGMVMYESGVLDEMIAMCREHDILTIADEVMTGFGRTGTFFACDQLLEKPNMVCLSKGLTGGVMAMGVTSATQEIYDVFYSDDRMKTFFHGHSFTANPMTCAAALASLDIFENEKSMEHVERISLNHATFRSKIRHHPLVKDCRHKGVILVIEVDTGLESGYFDNIRDRLYEYFMGEGILMRPLGNILYILPPYCISDFELGLIYQSVEACLDKMSVQIANT
ncbi:MAG: adenosylmethionine--8-amino-7-oxononanoate transaminase [Flavobacteriales bacterium]|nr:adenosylmethionine--8-amino-7-oxononanoate transaminase [Flavobacteriales bacterium]